MTVKSRMRGSYLCEFLGVIYAREEDLGPALGRRLGGRRNVLLQGRRLTPSKRTTGVWIFRNLAHL